MHACNEMMQPSGALPLPMIGLSTRILRITIANPGSVPIFFQGAGERVNAVDIPNRLQYTPRTKDDFRRRNKKFRSECVMLRVCR